ncbi:GTP-binding protein [Streptomyces sp. NPDC087420]|uniref:GTP-binding protein n=1 Tax=Streptomyces sp. NPDC087420 TaxID=3365785 RepID=UPI0038388412
MDFAGPSPLREAPHSPPPARLPENALMLKVVVAGPFAVGKTTFVSAVSEIQSRHTEELMTQAGALVDDLDGVDAKTHTTVGTDFGRLTLDDRLVLYLFGSPGQKRFRVLWDDIVRGALGILVLVDTGRLDAAFEVMDMVEAAGLPYVVGVNRFPASPVHSPDDVRAALDLPPGTPVVGLDARDRDACLDALITMTQHVLSPLEMV